MEAQATDTSAPLADVLMTVDRFAPAPETDEELLDTTLDGDRILARYFREMPRPMSVEEEQELAMASERADIAHWCAVLDVLPVACKVLDALETALGKEGISPPEIEALRDLFTSYARHGKLSAHDAERYRALCERLAREVRLSDSDRRFIGDATQVVRVWAARSSERVRFLPPIDEAARAAAHAKKRFVRANLRLVVVVARRFDRGRLPLNDLIQEGNLGLIRAVERFDHRRGYRFSTYAAWWIRHTIGRAIADKGRAVRIPVNVLAVHHLLRRGRRTIHARTGRAATLDELERETGIPLETLERIGSRHVGTTFSLDQRVGEDGDPLVDLIEDREACSPEEKLSAHDSMTEVERLFVHLTPKEMRILRWRFGLWGAEELTLKEIGVKYSLSRERVRQLQEAALHKLRRMMES